MRYLEMGIGNPSLVSTELEDESRIPYHMVYGWKSIYLRLWFGYRVFILDSVEGIKFQRKSRMGVKILMGISGK